MCNRYRLTAKQAEVAATFGIHAPYEIDETFPAGDIFPTGKRPRSTGPSSFRTVPLVVWSGWNGACPRRCQANVTRRSS